MEVISEGDIAKYQVKVKREGFDPDASSIEITLSWGRFGSTLTVPKTAMYHDEEGRLFLLFSTGGMFGPVTATSRFSVPDSDFGSQGEWEGTDRQVLCYVEQVPGFDCTHVCGAACEDREVEYNRIFRADANTAYEILRDNGGSILLDTDGREFRVKKSNLL